MSAAAPRACIAAMMKLERPYLIEWIAWHRLLGFEIVIADHGGNDGQSELLAKLHALKLIHRLDVRSIQGDVQRPFYRMLFRWARRNEYDYVGFLDGDEFFEPMTIGTRFEGSGAALIDRLFRQNQAAAVSFNWMIFGDSHRMTGDPELVTSRFHWAATQSFEVNHHVKSFSHVDRCHAYFRQHLRNENAIEAHHPNVPADRMLHDGQPVRETTNRALTAHVSWQLARVRHYVIKTREEYHNRKTNRGGFWTHYNQQFFDHHNRNDVLAPLPTHVIERLHREVAAITGEVEKVPAMLIPAASLFSRDQMLHRWNTRPYFKSLLHGTAYRWRRGVEKSRQRLGRATGRHMG
jgi:Glycosyl transferase family 2